MPDPSRAYFEALEGSKRIHGSAVFTGKFVRPHAPFIKEIIDRLGCKTVLDFGCGKGQQYEWVMPNRGLTLEQYWGVPVTKYDPAWEPFAAEPQGTFDLVICTHTLGAIPTADLPWVIDRLYALSNKAIYVAEKLGIPRKRVHSDPSVMPIGWTADHWVAALRRDSRIEVTLSTREKTDGGAVLSHFRKPPDTKDFWRHHWPEGMRAFDHTTA